MPSVVIADNNQFYQQVLADFYRQLGFDARVARDGIEALELIKQRRPDLLLLDLIMPRIDGAQLCNFLKGKEEFRDLPVIILSGIIADEIEGLEEIRADAFIAKMPLPQIEEALRTVTEAMLAGGTRPAPSMHGFERMYRREVVLELLAERKTRRDILDSLSEGIVELSADRKLLSLNRAFELLTERSPQDVLSRGVEEIFPESGPVLKDLFDQIERGVPMASATIRRAGRELRAKLHRFDPGGGPGAAAQGVEGAVREAARTTQKVRLESMIGSVRYTMLLEDVTQEARVERERSQLRDRLSRSEKLSAIGMFVSGAAHELNNPLTTVLGYAELLLQRNPDGALRRELERIVSGAGRCKSVLESLMVFAKAIRPKRVPQDINDLIGEAALGFADRLRRAGATLETALSPGLPEAYVDPGQMSQAFAQILDNAVKALTGHPGARRLTIRTALTGDRILVEFTDSGPGMPNEQIGRVFDPFFTTRQVGQGAGLGLSVAYGIVSGHGGQLSARNNVGSPGATIAIELPVISPGAVQAADAARELRAETGVKRILIVDDESVVLELLMDVLEGLDHRIDTAINGLQGLQRVDEHDYDLIILDLRMPDMTGQQMYEELARRRPRATDKVLFITADTVSPDVGGFLERTGKPCITKPFSIQTLMDAATAILASGAQEPTP